MKPVVTTVIMSVLFAVIIIIDVVLAATGNITYSNRLRALGKLWPPARLLISLGIGLLLGHLWWT